MHERDACYPSIYRGHSTSYSYIIWTCMFKIGKDWKLTLRGGPARNSGPCQELTLTETVILHISQVCLLMQTFCQPVMPAIHLLPVCSLQWHPPVYPRMPVKRTTIARDDPNQSALLAVPESCSVSLLTCFIWYITNTTQYLCMSQMTKQKLLKRICLEFDC